MRVVVVGGGFAGSVVVKGLCGVDGVEVVLVDDKPYWELPLANINSVVRKEREEMERVYRSRVVMHEEYVRGEVVVGRVEAVAGDGRSVRMANGDVIEADHIVLTCGSSYPLWKSAGGGGLEERVAELEEWRGRVQAANEVLVIGGGDVGVEAAAEIASEFEDVVVHLVHSGASLVEAHGATMQAKAVAWFERKENARLHLGQRAQEREDGVWETSGGAELTPDVVVRCVGVRPNSQLMQEELGACLDERGFVRVNKVFQVHGMENVWALGDVNDLPVLMAKTAREHAELWLDNFDKVRKGEGGLKEWEAKVGMCLLSLGKQGGVFEAAGWAVLQGWTWKGSAVAAWVKEKVAMDRNVAEVRG